MEAQITRLRSTRKICLTFSSRSCGDAELALHQWKRYTCVGVRTLLDLTALRCPACLPGASSLQHLKRSVVGSVHCCPLSNLQLLLLPKIQVCVKGSRTLIESSLVFGFNRISDMECGGLLVWFIFRLADGGIWRWRVEAGSEVKCYQFIWSLLALLENLQRSWTHYSNVTWPCRASSGVWGTESSWLRPWIAAAWTQPVTVYSHAPPPASSPTRTFRHMDAHTDNKKPLMAQKPAAAWSSACQKSNFYYNYYYYPAAFATFPCFALKPWTPPLCSREATLSLICRLELNLCCRVTCNALETSLTAGVQWLGTSLWMLVYFIIMETNNILFISKGNISAHQLHF